MRIITRTIWILSLVSLFTDTASEMLYPVMPVYLKSIGFSIAIIGLLEGFAEAIAGLSKGYFGKWSDTVQKRLPFVQLGYLISAISKPMIAFFVAPVWIFLCRTIDRIGKGVRTGARDALLSDEATLQTKASVFGFHRSMDTLGAVLGPSFALVYLYYHPDDYASLFYIAFVPGLLAIVASLLLKEKKHSAKANTGNTFSLFSFFGYWKQSTAVYKNLCTALLLFALFNSSDIFLLMKIKESGASDTHLIGAYIFYNLIYVLAAYPAGKLADEIGFKKVMINGLLLFIVVYTGFAFTTNTWLHYALFALYGIYAASTEGIAKAWITNITDSSDTATAIGAFSAFQSICALFASSITGFIWWQFGSKAVFITSAATTLLSIFLIMRVKSPVEKSN